MISSKSDYLMQTLKSSINRSEELKTISNLKTKQHKNLQNIDSHCTDIKRHYKFNMIPYSKARS